MGPLVDLLLRERGVVVAILEGVIVLAAPLVPLGQRWPDVGGGVEVDEDGGAE
jgi:hypothetical protein